MKAGWKRIEQTILGAFLLCISAAGLAETLAMPDREALVGEDVVLWGVTDQAGNYTLDCGNGSTSSAAVGDGSYIAMVCNYGAEGVFTGSLTVGGESDTVDVAVFDGPGLSAIDLRGVQINMAIEDGLRYLWVSQQNRAANFPSSPTTRWPYFWSSSEASVIALAFQNQGYRLPADGSAPTGIYEKYIVQRALNYVIESLKQVQMGVTPQGDDPCVGPALVGDVCVGLYDGRHDDFHQSYTTGLATLALAGSGALNRVVAAADVPAELSGGFVVGKTYGDILQRMANALSWGQIDAGFVNGRGGWYYNFNSSSSDGSTIGWVILGLLDAEAAGATVPAWVRSEFGSATGGKPFVNLNNDGTIDYQANNNPASNNSVGPAKNGIGLQGLFLIGELSGPNIDTGAAVIDSWWNGLAGTGGNSWNCRLGGQTNFGCLYTMYNNFKGLKLQGIQTLPSVGRPAGPGSIPENDWHEDYKDWLLANQNAPTTVTGGGWDPVTRISSQDFNGASPLPMRTGLAELLLSPVTLVLPDPVTFGEIGLQHCLDGLPCTDRTPEVDGDPTDDTNPAGTDHTVVARALSSTGTPIPGTTIDIDIISGPNSPLNFQGNSDSNGEVQFTYTSDGTAGTDTIQASIGNLTSNLLTKVWVVDEPEPQCSDGIDNDGDGDIDEADDGCSGPEDNDESDDPQPLTCDMDGDGDIDRDDIEVIFGLRGTTVPPSDPLADLDDNGIININDARGCVLRCTRQSCAVEVEAVQYNPKDPGAGSGDKEPIRPTWNEPASQPGASKLKVSPEDMEKMRWDRQAGQTQ